jgi:hypothetical protein|tara:strand:+ start:76 stop:438 length:363 start_codon:yes stop_codon:yes gene_type:complete
METVRKLFLDPDGWQYFHLLGTGAFFKKLLHQTDEESTVLIHHIPSGVTNATSRPIFVFTGTPEEAGGSYIEKNIKSIPFSLSLDLGELDIDVMGQEYINFLMSLHDRRRESFKTFADSL